jgi:hypothetical protein
MEFGAANSFREGGAYSMKKIEDAILFCLQIRQVSFREFCAFAITDGQEDHRRQGEENQGEI